MKNVIVLSSIAAIEFDGELICGKCFTKCVNDNPGVELPEIGATFSTEENLDDPFLFKCPMCGRDFVIG